MDRGTFIRRTTGLAVLAWMSGPIKAVESLAAEVASPIPAGTVMPYAGNALPAGWLLCDGSVVSIRDYPRLAFIGDVYGRAPRGKSRLPDLRGRPMSVGPRLPDGRELPPFVMPNVQYLVKA